MSIQNLRNYLLEQLESIGAVKRSLDDFTTYSEIRCVAEARKRAHAQQST